MIGKYSRDYINERFKILRSLTGIDFVLHNGASSGINDKDGNFQLCNSGTGEEQCAYARGLLDAFAKFLPMLDEKKVSEIISKAKSSSNRGVVS